MVERKVKKVDGVEVLYQTDTDETGFVEAIQIDEISKRGEVLDLTVKAEQEIINKIMRWENEYNLCF